MPQTANSLHFYIRRGGYEPAFSLHTTVGIQDAWSMAQAIMPQLMPMIPSVCVLTRIEYQNQNGLVLDEMAVGDAGDLANAFADFRDCTHFTWISAGPEGRSGMYLHPRPAGVYVEGEATTPWAALVDAFVAQVVDVGFTDSEGIPITGVRAVRPSRRRRVRLAP